MGPQRFWNGGMHVQPDQPGSRSKQAGGGLAGGLCPALPLASSSKVGMNSRLQICRWVHFLLPTRRVPKQRVGRSTTDEKQGRRQRPCLRSGGGSGLAWIDPEQPQKGPWSDLLPRLITMKRVMCPIKHGPSAEKGNTYLLGVQPQGAPASLLRRSRRRSEMASIIRRRLDGHRARKVRGMYVGARRAQRGSKGRVEIYMSPAPCVNSRNASDPRVPAASEWGRLLIKWEGDEVDWAGVEKVRGSIAEVWRTING